MKYEVGMAIDGRFYATVEASSLEEAKAKAIDAYMDADFGELECIDMTVINATDEKDTIFDFV